MIVASLVGFALAQDAPFADLVRTHALTASDDYRLGSTYLELSGWLHGRVDDPALTARVERIARRALDGSDRPDLVLNVIVVESPEVNAAAFPGGFLAVNRGAADLFDDDELLFVLGHEIAHVQLRHYAAGENLVAALDVLPQAQQAVASTDRQRALDASRTLERLLAKHGRQLEFEADLYGLLYAVRAGAPAAKAVSAIRKLEAATGPIPAELADAITHPDFAERVEQLERGRETLDRVQRKFDLGLSALTAGMDALAVESFQEFLTLFPRSSAGWTNLAAAHLRQGLAQSADPWLDRVPMRIDSGVVVRDGGGIERERARDACARAARVDPNLPECLVMLGVLARHAGDLDAARELYARADALSRVGGGQPGAELFVNRGIVEALAGREAQALALWDEAEAVEAGEPWSRANRAVLLERNGDAAGALALWKELSRSGRLDAQASAAIARLDGAAGSPVVRPSAALALGPIAPGATPESVKAALGEPERTDGDPIGLAVYWMWPSKGVNALFFSDSVAGIECWGPCRLDVKGVRVGSAWGDVHEKIGRPSEIVADALNARGRSAYYPAQGLTVTEEGGRVAKIALWRAAR